jgi:hypothetical protein
LGYIDCHIRSPAKTLDGHRCSGGISNDVERLLAVFSTLLDHGYAVDRDYEITSMQAGIREGRTVFAGVDVEAAYLPSVTANCGPDAHDVCETPLAVSIRWH